MGRKPVRQWGPYDGAIWYTCAIANAVQWGDLQGTPDIAVTFALQWPEFGEQIFGSAEMALLAYTSPGDGSYLHSGGLVLASGAGGLALTAGAAAFRGMGNASRRRQAEALAQPRWMPIDGGLLHVGTHGFYLQTPHGLYSWSWAAVTAAQVVDVGKVWVQGKSDRGTVSWVIESHWAELLFVLWAMARAPRHPQLLDGSWLPAYWITWATEQGYAPPPLQLSLLP